MEHILELHEFFVEGGNPDRSHVLLHITEPSSPSEMQKGYFFALVEIVGGTAEQIEHLQLIIDALETGYYETEDTDDKDAFELTVEYVNRRGHHMLKQHNAMITCLVGVLRGHSLSFAYHGLPELYLMYSNKEQDGVMKLCEDDTDSREQLFSSITQGTLNSGDYLYASTPHTSDYLSIDRVQKILTGRPTRHAADHVEKVLKDLRNDLSFGGLMLHILKKPEIPKTGSRPKPIVEEDDTDLLDLDARAAKTQQVLSPPLMSSMKDKVRSYKEERKSKPQRSRKTTVETNHRARQAPKPSVGNQLLVTIGRTVVGSLIALVQAGKKLIILLGKVCVGMLLLITNRGGQRETVIAAVRRSIQNKKQWIEDLPILSKLLFVLTIIFGIIFVASIGIIRVKENRQAIAQQYTSSVQAIQDKQSAAEASLIYDDREKALILLQEAQILLADLPENSQERRETKQRLHAGIEDVLLSLRNMTVVEPRTIVDLKTINEQANTAQLAMIDGQLVAYGADDSQLYFVDPNTSQTSMKQYESSIHLQRHSTPKEDDEIVFITRDQGIASYSKETNTVRTKDIVLANDQAALADIFVYNQRLYAIDVANNQLFRHSKTQTGYDRGSAWITDDVDVSDGTAVAIDGDIFILKSNGQLLKFAKGKREEFSISGLDPQLDKPTMLWTYNDVNNLYILEPTNKRVVVLDKNGKLLTQYTAETWQQPSGMVVDETKNTVYLLDQNTVYSFSLS